VTGSLKAERGPAKTALRNAELLAEYHALDFLQRPLGYLFWKIEQRKARLQDRIENEGGEP
jgi:hypothetical protein